MKKIIVLLFIFSIGCLFSQKKTALITYTFEEAYALQEKEKRPLVVFFHTDWCKYCFTMQKNTFTDKKVIQLLNDTFYFISFDGESKASINIKGNLFKNKSGTHQITEALASKNGTISYPSTIIIGTENMIDEQIDSFLSAKELQKVLKTYIKLHKQ